MCTEYLNKGIVFFFRNVWDCKGLDLPPTSGTAGERRGLVVMVEILAYSGLVRGKILPVFLEHMDIYFFFFPSLVWIASIVLLSTVLE